MKIENKIENWSIKRWKKEAWKYCSLYNRQKDIVRGIGICCTCPKIIRWQDGDAGHFMAGRGGAVLFYDKGIHLQCKECNRNQGEQYLYAKYIEKRYGKEEVAKQLKLRHAIVKRTVQDYIDLIEKYKQAIEKLNKYN